jgi:hypothetical protein
MDHADKFRCSQQAAALRSVTVTMWKLNLFHGDDHWKTGFEQKLFGNPKLRRLGIARDDMKKESVGQAFEKSPIDAGASPEGWLRSGWQTVGARRQALRFLRCGGKVARKGS